MIIKAVDSTNIDSTMVLCEYYREEAGISDDDYDHNSVLETIKTRSIHAEYCWFNLYEGQRPVGFISGCLTQAPWNKNILYAHIELVFILESHRSLDNFKMLIDAFTKWGTQFKVVDITAGDIGINVDRTRKLYEHLGFTQGLWMTKEMINE